MNKANYADDHAFSKKGYDKAVYNGAVKSLFSPAKLSWRMRCDSWLPPSRGRAGIGGCRLRGEGSFNLRKLAWCHGVNTHHAFQLEVDNLFLST